MDIQFAKNFRQMTDWLAQGRYSICFGCKDSMRAKNQGLPVDDFDTTRWKEGSSFSSGGGSLSYPNQAPHPNAAKVFINWFLSRRGQIALQKLGDVDDPPNSRRIDIPKDDVPPTNRMVARRQIFRCRQTGVRRSKADRRSRQGDHGGDRREEVVAAAGNLSPFHQALSAASTDSRVDFDMPMGKYSAGESNRFKIIPSEWIYD